MKRTVVIRDIEDGQTILTARTTMTDTQIKEACSDETLDENNCDYEERLIAHAEQLGCLFERTYADETIYV